MRHLERRGGGHCDIGRDAGNGKVGLCGGCARCDAQGDCESQQIPRCSEQPP